MLRWGSKPSSCREGQREQGRKLHASLARECPSMLRRAAFPVGVLAIAIKALIAREKTGIRVVVL